ICSIAFAVFPGGSFSLDAFHVLGSDAKLSSAIVRTLLITAVTIAVLIAALVPAVVAVHLWAPRLRTVLEILCTLPLVVPPIALVAGVVAI
ncbi:spermidine/putrescine ABC transporter permease, partial [Brevibacterium paucivorans]